jgi:hypothetical protein
VLIERNGGTYRRWLYLFIIIVPLSVAAGILKVAVHDLGWEFINWNVFPLLSSVFTAAIFLMGFMLAGLMGDHKESEKFPAEMIASLYSISREADILSTKGVARSSAIDLQYKIAKLVDTFRADFFADRPSGVFDLLDSFSEDFGVMDDNGVPPALMARLRNEQTNLQRILLRIKAIKETYFVPGVYSLLDAIIVLFTVAVLLLRFESPTVGVYSTSVYFFILSSIMLLLKDLEDPFQYSKGKNIGVNEVDFSSLYDFGERIRNKVEIAAGDAETRIRNRLSI